MSNGEILSMNKFSCVDCKKEITVNNYKHHTGSVSCKLGLTQKIHDDRLTCKFCNTICASNNSRSQHELWCKLNPDRKPKSPTMTGRIPWNKGLTRETDSRVAKYAATTQNLRDNGLIYTGHVWSEDEKRNHSIKMASVASTSESYSGRYNRGFVKEIICRNGFKVLGSWEELFVNFCLGNNIEIEQPHTPFSYIFEDRSRAYYPDFYLPEYDLYIEVKGYETDKDKAKWYHLQNTHGKNLMVIKLNEITSIKNNSFTLS